MTDIMTIDFTSKVIPVKPINDQFTLCKCYVMALGKNRNGTIISKQAADDALPSLYNIPVVGHVYVDEDGAFRMGGHDMAIEDDKDGNINLTPITVPYGTVPMQEGVHYEEVDENGTKQTYLVADIILWTGRYPELLEAKYNEEVFFAQSMEIQPYESKKTKDGLDVRKFQFSALCLLGKSDDREKNVAPCFRSARVEPYVFSEGGMWTELFEEFKQQLFSAGDVEKEGGVMNTETIKKILLEFGLPEDTALSFEVAESMSEEELRAKIQETYSNSHASESESGAAEEEEAQEEPVQGGEITYGENEEAQEKAGEAESSVQEEPVLYALELTYEQKREALEKTVEGMGHWTETQYAWYCLLDFDSTYAYVHCHCGGEGVEEFSGDLRIPYDTQDGTVKLGDVESAKAVRLVWLTKEDEDKLDADRAQLAELMQYKADRIAEDKRKAYAEVLGEFQDLGEIDAYKAVVKDAMTFSSVDDLREKLYAIRGKFAASKPGKKPLSTIHIPVGTEPKKDKKTEADEFMARYYFHKK